MGFRGFGDFGFSRTAPGSDPDRPTYIPWSSHVLDDLRARLEVKNVFLELGSAFAQTSVTGPVLFFHMIGQMMDVDGVERILWGTYSIWGGSPQSQIERFARLQMTEEPQESHAYAPLDDEVKAKILGHNAASLFGMDADE